MEWLKRKLWEKGGSVALVLEEEEQGGGGPAAVGASNGGQGGPSAGAGGGVSKAHSVELRVKLSAAELTWLRNYASLLTAYKSEFLDILDIASPLSSSSARRGGGLDYKPPDELMVTVVAMRDAREVMTEMGTLNLRRGERMRVRRNEVEALIVRGWLEVAED